MLLSVTKCEDNKMNEPEAFQLDDILQCVMVQVLYSRHKCHLGVEFMLDESVFSNSEVKDMLVHFWKPEEQESAREPRWDLKKKSTNYLTTIKNLKRNAD